MKLLSLFTGNILHSIAQPVLALPLQVTEAGFLCGVDLSARLKHLTEDQHKDPGPFLRTGVMWFSFKGAHCASGGKKKERKIEIMSTQLWNYIITYNSTLVPACTDGDPTHPAPVYSE